MNKQAYLILENGAVFEGVMLGAETEVIGEVVFTTAMTGYLETLTDPSYYGQIVVQTFPLMGNYGVIPQDFESEKPQLCAYVMRECCQVPSNFRAQGTLEAYLKQQGIVALCGIDTRALTRIVREAGVMNGMITKTPQLTDEQKQALGQYRVTHAVESVSRHAPYTLPAEGEEKKHVVLWDFGAKGNIARSLQKRGCRVTVMPAMSTAAEILGQKPDGVMLSNGPGDPAENMQIIEQLRLVCKEKLPIFGICMGHQLLALSQGAKTEKMKYGHRGANQPVKDLDSGRVYITSQNHGYAVVNDSVPEGAKVQYINVNDGTCEGIAYTTRPAFSVQFHPEACAGPMDTAFLFDRFMAMMEGGSEHADF